MSLGTKASLSRSLGSERLLFSPADTARPPEKARLTGHPTSSNARPRAIFRTSSGTGEPFWLELADPVSILEAASLEEVVPVLEHAEKASRTGLHAAGFVTYEAAAAFDAALVTHRPGELPLAWFGLFRGAVRHSSLPLRAGLRSGEGTWKPSIEVAEYRRAIEQIRSAIALGDTYQANFTFRLRADFSDDPAALFARLIETQPVGHAAFVDLGRHVICSASPELFFRLRGSQVTCRPMKGTSRRGLTTVEDRKRALSLYYSEKDRAENLMIVDMIRNDLGRVAAPGSVTVGSLFELERYASVHQLTSEVRATTDRSIVEILSALFPCASITGAPKVATMRLLAALESSPRGIYTGTVGYISPDRNAEFNVAIRTVHVDRRSECAEFGTGGGVVWDSDADAEYAECSAKASVLTLRRPRFELLETMRLEPDGEIFLLERHLERLARSAEYFGFPFDRQRIESALGRLGPGPEEDPRRVRLRLFPDGSVDVAPAGRAARPARPWRVALSPEPVRIDDVLLYHKTTARAVYERARAEAPGHDDVLLWNDERRITESTVANLVVESAGRRLTPPVGDGLLAGTFRDELLERGEIEVGSVTLAEISRADRVWLVNSVRKWIPVDRIDDPRPGHPPVLWRNLAA